MIEIDYHLLSELAVENLIMTLLTRETTDYGEEQGLFMTRNKPIIIPSFFSRQAA